MAFDVHWGFVEIVAQKDLIFVINDQLQANSIRITISFEYIPEQ